MANTKVRTRGGKTIAGHMINWIFDVHGVQPTGELRLHESLSQLIRDYKRQHPEVSASEGAIMQALRRHPRLVTIDPGRGRKKGTFVFYGTKFFEHAGVQNGNGSAEPAKPEPDPDPEPEALPPATVGGLLGDLEAALTRQVEARVRGEWEARQTLCEEELGKANELIEDLTRRLHNVRELLG